MYIQGCSGSLPKGLPLEGWAADTLRVAPLDRWDVDAPLISGLPGRFGGFVEGWQEFDAEVFGMSPSETAVLDPQQRRLLQVTTPRVLIRACVPHTSPVLVSANGSTQQAVNKYLSKI